MTLEQHLRDAGDAPEAAVDEKNVGRNVCSQLRNADDEFAVSFRMMDIVERGTDKLLPGDIGKNHRVFHSNSARERRGKRSNDIGHRCSVGGKEAMNGIAPAMGVTQQVPLQDHHSYSREYLLNRIKILLGGRTAEELVFNQYTTGASNDLQQATDIATRMVCEWGMSDALGPRAYASENRGFLGDEAVRKSISEETSKDIDREINRIIEQCYQEAVIILEGKINHLHKLAEVLLQEETVDAHDIEIIIECKRVGEDEPMVLVE